MRIFTISRDKAVEYLTAKIKTAHPDMLGDITNTFLAEYKFDDYRCLVVPERANGTDDATMEGELKCGE